MCNDSGTLTGMHTAEPLDVLVERLNDPGVAASLVTLLDNAELLSTLVLGLAGLVERGDLIMDAVADMVGEVKAADGSANMPPIKDLSEAAGALAGSAPLLTSVLDSPMTSPDTIELLSTMSEAATEGAANARANQTVVKGPTGAYKAMKDPEVQKGLGLMIEIARSLGRRF